MIQVNVVRIFPSVFPSSILRLPIQHFLRMFLRDSAIFMEYMPSLKLPMHFSLSPMPATCPSHIIYDFGIVNKCWGGVQSWYSLLWDFLQPHQRSLPSPMPCVTFRNRTVRVLLPWQAVDPSPNPQAGVSPIVGCRVSFIHCTRICIYPSYLKVSPAFATCGGAMPWR